MKIAVVGSGISGLVSSYLLSRQHHVVLFEAGATLGGHTNTVNVSWQGETHDIDTGFIVFNDWTYPNFIGLLDELHVASQPTSMGFSVRCDRCGLEYSGYSLATLFAQKRNLLSPSHYRMLWDILRFNKEAPLAVEHLSEDVTIGQFLREGGYSKTFAEHYLLPMGAAIWSCPMATFDDFPVRFIIEFYRNHGLLSVRNRPTWRVVKGGSKRYIEQMTQQMPTDIRLACPVQQVTRHDQGVVVMHSNQVEEFDEVVFACHSDQALQLLRDPSSCETEVLQSFPYGQNTAVLHTDESVLPRQRSVWSSWNYHIRNDEERPSVTYNMNILQGLASRYTYNVTLNEAAAIRPDRVLGTFNYTHPIFTTARAAAQARHGELVRSNRTSFCGAYWGNGFHEDGVTSALRVGQAFGIRPSWSCLALPAPAMQRDSVQEVTHGA